MRSYIWIICIFFFLQCFSSKKSGQYVIKKGEFIASLSETGELEAVNSRVISVPSIGWKYGWGIKVLELLEHGTRVSAGDTIAKFDDSGVLRYLMEKQNNLEVEKAALNKMVMEHKNRLKSMEAELSMAESVLDMQKVQLQKHQFESDRKRNIKKLELERASVENEKVGKKYELLQTILANELKVQKIKIFQLENEIRDAKEALDQLVITSPLNGMMQILKNWRVNKMVREGDELGQGWPFACIPDLSAMRAKATVNEADIDKAFLQQDVEISLDAFPKKLFHGQVSEIGRLGYKKDEKSRTKIFDIEVLVKESDPILKPGMTVNCQLRVAKLQDVYFIENECIVEEDKQFYIFTGDCKKCPIKIGPRNNRFTVIYGDFAEGQRFLSFNEIQNNGLLKAG